MAIMSVDTRPSGFRRPAVQEMLAGLAHGMDALHAAVTSRQHGHQRRGELRRLGDHALRDLGLRRAEIGLVPPRCRPVD